MEIGDKKVLRVWKFEIERRLRCEGLYFQATLSLKYSSAKASSNKWHF